MGLNRKTNMNKKYEQHNFWQIFSIHFWPNSDLKSREANSKHRLLNIKLDFLIKTNVKNQLNSVFIPHWQISPRLYEFKSVLRWIKTRFEK